MKMKRILFLLFSLSLISITNAQKKESLTSPNGLIRVEIYVGEDVKYQVFHENDLMLDWSSLSMTLTDGRTLGAAPQLIKVEHARKNELINSSIYKRSVIEDRYNQLTLRFKGNYNILFRVYDEGIAYRFETFMKESFKVENEHVEFAFPSDQYTYISYVGRKGTIEEQFFNSFENTYSYKKLSEWEQNRLAFLPIVSENKTGKKVAILEADLLDYPGLYLLGNQNNTLKGVFAPYPTQIEQGGHNQLQGIVKSRAGYIAQSKGNTSFPWRIVVVSEQDKELADNDIVYKLATPSAGDFSWIKPGKVAWDWWNSWNLYGVDFRTGINNETYKYYIDFASESNIEYVIIDEGWAVNLEADLHKIVPEINLSELIDYANSKQVGIILWVGYYAFNKDIEGLCKHYSQMGVKGFKIDFMDRDDQPMVEFHHQVAKIAAQYQLLIDFHGTYKPTGLQRTYPNVINFEGVHGLEQMKWATAEVDQVTYDVTIPFIRQLAGPMDYTQGAMRNAIKKNYYPVYDEAMSQGTRCRQLAQYVIFESPLNMLCDNPSNYLREPDCTEFIAKIPTIWEETKVLDGKVGKYIITARKSGDYWYIGGMTDWETREVEIDLSFLGAGEFKAELFKDGINADKVAHDYKKEIIEIPNNRKLAIQMISGGGFAMRLYCNDTKNK